jgi:hypothetical protein
MPDNESVLPPEGGTTNVSQLTILLIGDVVGHPGRDAVRALLPSLGEEYRLDFVIANAENAARGFGVSRSTAKDLWSAGVHVLTAGNHFWDQQDAADLLSHEAHLLRPANCPPEVAGRGSGVFTTKKGAKVGVLHLLGVTFMQPYPCPFRTAEAELERLCPETNVVIVDFHAEATSEKVAMGWFLDGRVSAVLGTHTHVQTADEQILPGDTAYLTDCGMTGAMNSVLGMNKDIILERFLTKLPLRHQVAEGKAILCGAVVTVDEATGKAVSIQRLQKQTSNAQDPSASRRSEGAVHHGASNSNFERRT